MIKRKELTRYTMMQKNLKYTLLSERSDCEKPYISYYSTYRAFCTWKNYREDDCISDC